MMLTFKVSYFARDNEILLPWDSIRRCELSGSRDCLLLLHVMLSTCP